VKKLRRKQTRSHEHANVYLAREYLPEHNRRFARGAAKPEDYHRRPPRAAELDKIFRLESERTISEDWVVRYDNRWFQLEGPGRYYAPAQGKVLVCEGRHGRIAIEYRGRALRWQEIAAPLRPTRSEVHPVVKQATESCTKPKWVPPENHPWRQAARRGAQQKALRESAGRSSSALPSASP
jgi:hypothetical protein